LRTTFLKLGPYGHPEGQSTQVCVGFAIRTSFLRNLAYKNATRNTIATSQPITSGGTVVVPSGERKYQNLMLL